VTRVERFDASQTLLKGVIKKKTEDQLRHGVADGGTSASKGITCAWVVVFIFGPFSCCSFPFFPFDFFSVLSPRCYTACPFDLPLDQRAIRVRTNSVAAERHSGSFSSVTGAGAKIEVKA
jgi:hypothetical protein